MPGGDSASNSLVRAANGGNAAGNASSSSDFVRKLYKMLEDPQYAELVWWGKNGTSFVVLEKEEFTKNILPKHFKHSNFASFVRQLNKYDFHKVRHSDEGGQSPYPPHAWEFTHPEFRAGCKENLDNIRRKAPAPRRQQANDEQYAAAAKQMIDSMASEISHLRREMTEMQRENNKHTRMLADQIGRMSKVITRQNHVMDELTQFHIEKINEETDEKQPISEDRLPRRITHVRALINDMFRDLGNDVIMLNPLYEECPNPDGTPARPAVPEVSDPPPYGMGPGLKNRAGSVNSNGLEVVHQDAKPRDIWGDRKPWILLVEDEGTCAKIAVKRLEVLSCNYDYCRNGGDAVRMVNAEPRKYDLILMDIRMPVLTGMEATSLIRVENHPRMPIIAMTTSHQPDDFTTYLKHGMDDLLPKPFTKSVFEALLRKHLSHLLASSERAGEKKTAPGPSERAAATKHPGPTSIPPVPMMVNTNFNNYERTPINSPSGSISWVQSPATTNGQAIQGASPVTATATSTVMNPTLPSGTMSNMPGGMAPGMQSQIHGSHMHNTPGMINSMDPSMPAMTMTSSNYLIPASTMGLPPMSRNLPVGNSAFTGLADGGVDFGDERPEKRSRLYGPEMGYPT